jgi:transcription elongation GreA/GreB family factor
VSTVKDGKKKEEIKRLKEIIKRLTKEKTDIYENNSNEEAGCQALLIKNELIFYQGLLRRAEEEKEVIYGTAKVVSQETGNPYQKKGMNVLVVGCIEEDCPESYIVATAGSPLGSAVIKGHPGEVVDYEINGKKFSLSIIEKNF